VELFIYSIHSLFTRWLFGQRRGDVQPFATLVTSYRQARPCVMGMLAARTGDTTGIRVDEQRPPLPPITGARPDGTVGLAVAFVVIVTPSEKLENRMRGWLSEHAKQLAGFNIEVVMECGGFAFTHTSL